MLTRREKLLNRPWQLRRYNNHRHKVLTALPAIDFGPPTERRHVTCKLKKLQWEGERRTKIEEENFKLLQRMGSIMKKNRLENHWETPPPDFLHRVGIYHRTRSPTPFRELESCRDVIKVPGKRRGCSACTPAPAKPPTIPEERVPWSPPKHRLSRRRSSSLVMEPKSDFDIQKSPGQRIKHEITTALPKLEGNRCKSVTSAAENILTETVEKKLVLTQGSLQLSVNFPPHAEVKILSGNEEKLIQRNHCNCVAMENKRKLNRFP